MHSGVLALGAPVGNIPRMTRKIQVRAGPLPLDVLHLVDNCDRVVEEACMQPALLHFHSIKQSFGPVYLYHNHEAWVLQDGLGLGKHAG